MTTTHTATRTQKKYSFVLITLQKYFYSSSHITSCTKIAEQEHIRHMSSKLMRWFSRFLPSTTHAATVPLYFLRCSHKKPPLYVYRQDYITQQRSFAKLSSKLEEIKWIFCKDYSDLQHTLIHSTNVTYESLSRSHHTSATQRSCQLCGANKLFCIFLRENSKLTSLTPSFPFL